MQFVGGIQLICGAVMQAVIDIAEVCKWIDVIKMTGLYAPEIGPYRFSEKIIRALNFGDQDFQLCGRSSLSLFTGWLLILSKTSLSHSYGFTLFIAHVPIRLYNIARRCAPFSLPAKRKCFRPRTMGRIFLSHGLLSG